MTIESSRYTYTLEDLQLLRDCIQRNGNVLSSALSVFQEFKTPHPSDGELIRFWLSMAEKLVKEPDYPEKAFKAVC